jgi:hypothetical protein
MHSGFSRLRRCDERIERSLYARATGYSYNAVKIFHTNDCDVSWRLLPTASSSRDVTGSKGPAPPGVGPPGMVDLLAWHPFLCARPPPPCPAWGRVGIRGRHVCWRQLTRVTICRELKHSDQINKSEHGETDRVAFWQCLGAKGYGGVEFGGGARAAVASELARLWPRRAAAART